jgi:hypothetical protein
MDGAKRIYRNNQVNIRILRQQKKGHPKILQTFWVFLSFTSFKNDLQNIPIEEGYDMRKFSKHKRIRNEQKNFN